jgi:hypothetical protein
MKQLKKPSTRSEKIKFLNDIKSGKISIDDYLPTACAVWIYNKETDQYKNTVTNVKYSSSEYDSIIKSKRRQQNIVVQYITLPHNGRDEF